MSGGTRSRHAACMECRQRKVRCDGGQPGCQNCLRRGSTCVFIQSMGQDKEEMLLMINELSDRLSHAEQSLATQNAPRPPPPPQDLLPDTDIDYQEFWDITSSGDSGALNESNMCLFPEAQDFGPIPDMHTSGTAPNDSSELNSISWQNLKTPQTAIGTVKMRNTDAMEEELSSYTVHELYRSYFEQTDSSCYMLEQDSFRSKMDILSPGPEFLSLKFIVLAHGASNVPSYCYLQNQLYNTSRKYFENAETGKAFVTIAALQACILLAMYELNHLLFSRAWGRISRAMWMAQMFGLHKMDLQTGTPQQRQSRFHLATTADPQELEERRRTFWSAFNLSCFTSTSAGWSTHAQLNHDDITTLVPTENGANSLVSPFRPTLHNILRLSGARKLSTFEALVLTSALYSRCLRHADFSLPESRVDYPSYDFWMHHYHISESVNQLTCSTNVDSTLPSSITEPSILYMNFRIQAIMICLHYAAVSRESKTNSTGSQSSESETKCLKAALNITNMTRQIREQANPINSSLYILWSVYVAAQVYVRAFHASNCRGDCPITPMHTPTTTSRSPKLHAHRYLLSVVSGNGGQGHSTHSSNSSLSSMSSHASILAPSRFDLLENIDCLLSALSAFKRSNLIAGVFEAQIYDELSGDKALTDNYPVGRVEFPLDGQYMVNDSVEYRVQDIWKLL